MGDRKLHNWELDRYWARILWTAIYRSWKAVAGKFGWQTVIAISTTIIAAVIQFLYLGWSSAADNLKISGSSLAAGTVVFVVLLILHLVRIPCEMAVSSGEDVAKLRNENTRLASENLSLKEPKPSVRPKLIWHAASYPRVKRDDSQVWRNSDEQYAQISFVFHIMVDPAGNSPGTAAQDVRAQIFWVYDTGVSGVDLSPACWLDEPCGMVDIPCGVSRRLLIGVRSADKCWYGWANGNMTPTGKPQTRLVGDCRPGARCTSV